MNTFSKIYQLVKEIPPGKVTTYGLIAEKLHIDARIVGWALHQNPDPKNIPCHRVVGKDGKLKEGYAFGGVKEQKRKLAEEGVKFKNSTRVDFTNLTNGR